MESAKRTLKEAGQGAKGKKKEKDMSLKKVNAVLSWLLCLSLLGHLLTMSYSFLTGWYNYALCKNLAYITAGFATVHVVISVILIFFFHDGGKVSYYGKRNLGTILQRATGIIIVAILHMHVKAFGFIVEGIKLAFWTKLGIFVTETIFFGAIFIHLAVSFSKSMISLGLLRTEKMEKIIDKVVVIVCSVLMLLTTISMAKFLIQWM